MIHVQKCEAHHTVGIIQPLVNASFLENVTPLGALKQQIQNSFTANCVRMAEFQFTHL